MYERSAIVLEKNFNTILGFDKKPNLKTIYKDYKEITEEIQKYQLILEEEDKIINEFDTVANEIRSIQQEQKRISKTNTKLEEDRNQLFDDLDEEPEIIEKKLIKIENSISANNEKLEESRKNYIKALTDFAQKQQDRNISSKSRRAEEKKHLQLIEKITNDFNSIDKNVLREIKEYLNSENEDTEKEIIDAMIENGKDERVPFNREVIENAVNIRNKIEKREAECYIAVYEKTKRLLIELNNDDIKLDKYTKNLRDVSLKLAFLKALKLYIVSFLDNERMAAINGVKVHNKLMSEACESFKADIEQFENLYELILREIAGKSSKKAYKELYNKEYLKNVEDKEKNFEKEVNNIRINAGALINSNYWRIEEIKNIYHIFQNEVSEKFGKDLSEFKLEEDDAEVVPEEKVEDDIFKTKISEEDAEYVEEFEFDDDDEYEDEYDEEYEDDDSEIDDSDDDEYEEDEEYDEYEEDDENQDDSDIDSDDEFEEDEEFEDEYDDNYNDEYDDDYDDEYDDYDDEEDDEEYDEDEYEEDDDDDYKEEDERNHNKHSKINKKQNKTKNTRKNNQKQEDSDNSKKGIGLFNKLFKQ